MFDSSNFQHLPVHIAIIPDGNRRWAKDRGLNPWEGHRQGMNNLEDILKTALRFHIKFFSFWGASLDNVDKRPKREVAFLLNLFRVKFSSIAKDPLIHENKIRIHVLGKWREKFPKLVCYSIEKAIDATKHYKDNHLNFLLAYNGTDEMFETIKKIANKARKDLYLKITPDLIKENLFTSELPPVDYIIRTGGEPHNSVGFMMWDSADAQYYFTNTLFPDFSSNEFIVALREYDKRERRFGK